MFKCIVVGVDGSVSSLLALKYASGLAESYGAKLIMVHSYPHTSDLREYDEYDKLLAKRKDAGHKVLDLARDNVNAYAVDVEVDLLEGPAANALLKVVKARRADLVVIGTRGMGSLKGVIFGSVSTKVMQYAPCPVMVVR